MTSAASKGGETVEIGIGIQSGNSIKSMSKESTLPTNEIEGFSRHLLGFVSNQNAVKKSSKEQDSETFLVSLGAILSNCELEGIGLTSEQMNDLAKIKELDIDQIAEIIGVNVEGIKALYSELQSARLGTKTDVSPHDGEEDYEILLGTLQLLQSALTHDLKGFKAADKPGQGGSEGRIEDVVKLAKVIELFTQNRDMHVSEASKAMELKDMVKNLQKGIEGTLSGMFRQSKDWSGLLKEAYTRQLPEEMKENPAKVEVSTLEKKNIQSGQGNPLHFVLPKTETFSMSLISSNRSAQYEQFVKEFQNLLGKSSMMSQPNMSKLLIKLYPEQLGSLRIELLQQNGVMTAKILASTSTAKEMLDSQIQGLKHAFSSQNLHVEKIEVSQALSDPERQYKGQSQQQSSQQQKQQQPDQPGLSQEEGDQSFKDYLVNTEI